MLTLQVVNKISLILDHHASPAVLAQLKEIVEGARKLPNYGLSSVIDMI